MLGKQIKIGTRRVWMHKSVRHTNFESESVLSNDPWLFVELWLKRNKKIDALAFWLQARRFAEAASSMSVESAPLTLYYAFLNATKALLAVRATPHGNRHGVSGERPETAKASLANEKVQFQSGGVLPALCTYLGDTASSQEYSLKDLLWNLPFVHRAFRHTFTSSPELFIPLEQACYVSRNDTSEGWFQAQVVPRYTDRRILRQYLHPLNSLKIKEKPTSAEQSNLNGFGVQQANKRNQMRSSGSEITTLRQGGSLSRSAVTAISGI